MWPRITAVSAHTLDIYIRLFRSCWTVLNDSSTELYILKCALFNRGIYTIALITNHYHMYYTRYIDRMAIDINIKIESLS